MRQSVRYELRGELVQVTSLYQRLDGQRVITWRSPDGREGAERSARGFRPVRHTRWDEAWIENGVNSAHVDEWAAVCERGFMRSGISLMPEGPVVPCRLRTLERPGVPDDPAMRIVGPTSWEGGDATHASGVRVELVDGEIVRVVNPCTIAAWRRVRGIQVPALWSLKRMGFPDSVLDWSGRTAVEPDEVAVTVSQLASLMAWASEHPDEVESIANERLLVALGGGR